MNGVLNVLDLFSGIGGFSLGLERAGMRTVAFCEQDEFCRAVLRKHWASVPCFGDIRDITADGLARLGRIDVVSGGFPCQPFSVAGDQKSKDDDRYLWPEMRRVIALARPAFVVGENVTGIVALALDDVLTDLEGMGYTTRTFVIPACAVDAKHRRDRVWIIARSDAACDGRQQGRTAEAEDIWQLGRVCHAGGSAANADSFDLRDGHADGRPDETRAAESRNDGEAQPLADADREPPAVSEHSGAAEGGAASASTRPMDTRDADRGGDDAWSSHVADSGGARLQGHAWNGEDESKREEPRRRSARTRRVPSGTDAPARWHPEPDVGRVAHGVPARVDRLRALGNSVVPQLVEYLGRVIIAAACEQQDDARMTKDRVRA